MNNVYQEINKTKILYLAYDCELMPMLITTSLKQIKNYCKRENVNFSEYPIGTYTHEDPTN